jgi:pimeloyl-ACP methyl ester carboxylesterase
MQQLGAPEDRAHPNLRSKEARMTFYRLVSLSTAALILGACDRETTQQKESGGDVSTIPANSIVGPAGPIHVDSGGTGDGIPVVFVHSYAGNTGHWESQLSHVRNERRAVALDLRGHGKSAPPGDDDYAVESLAGDIAAVVDSMKLGRFVLVGHSLGGSAAIAYAGAHSDRVAGLMLVGTPGRTPAAQAQQVMTALESNYDQSMQEQWNRMMADARPEVQQRLTTEMGSVPKDASIRIIREMFAYDPLPALQSYVGPTLIVYTPHGDMPNDLQNLLPQRSKERISGTSHWPHLDKPAEFNRLLDKFLAAFDSK